MEHVIGDVILTIASRTTAIIFNTSIIDNIYDSIDSIIYIAIIATTDVLLFYKVTYI